MDAASELVELPEEEEDEDAAEGRDESGSGVIRFVDLHLAELLDRHGPHMDREAAAAFRLLREAIAELAPPPRDVIHITWSRRRAA